MSVMEWTVPFELQTPVGDLTLNSEVTLPSGATGTFQVNPGASSTGIALRATDDFIPEQDGEQTHQRYWGGALMTLGVVLLEQEEVPACGALQQEMMDYLLKHVRAMTRPPAPPDDARVLWTPSGEAERMLKDVVINEPYAVSVIDNVFPQVAWQMKSPYPYAMDAAETTTALDATLTNAGSAEFWPVIRVTGGGSFTITNSSVTDDDGNALQIIFDGSYSGFAEIDCFNGTIFENGDGANLSGDIDFLSTDYFWLRVGTNDITIVGGSANVLWQNAWA